MANEEHLARLKEGVEVWNQWRNHNPEVFVDLVHTDLSRMNLMGVDFSRADLSRASLSKANLKKASLRESFFELAQLDAANLTGANLHEAGFFGANLTKANLTGVLCNGTDFTRGVLAGANFTRAQLIGVNFKLAYLNGGNLTRSSIGWSSFGDVNLSAVRGLETVQHKGPSTIGIDTLYLSHGNIPEVFLRGAGVPGEVITYAKSLVGRPFEFYSCFISYSSRDQAFAERLHADLQNKGVRCWFAPEDVQGGRKLHEQIDQAIRVNERLLLILSSYSMKSEWVKTEITKARQREVREQRQVLFPVRLVSFEAVRDWECFDADTGKDSTREIREYFIPDFSHWKDYEAYRQAFQRLLRDLKPNTASPSSYPTGSWLMTADGGGVARGV